jgi:hypothetical protein
MVSIEYGYAVIANFDTDSIGGPKETSDQNGMCIRIVYVKHFGASLVIYSYFAPIIAALSIRIFSRNQMRLVPDNTDSQITIFGENIGIESQAGAITFYKQEITVPNAKPQRPTLLLRPDSVCSSNKQKRVAWNLRGRGVQVGSNTADGTIVLRGG